MAVANVGVLLSSIGKAVDSDSKVLLVDWDLEAPGLDAYFRRSDLVRVSGDESSPGLVDLLEHKSGDQPLSWRECVNTATFSGGRLDLLSAGSREKGDDQLRKYRQRVQGLNWPKLYDEHSIGDYFSSIRDEWRSLYDFVLIDSRTGMTDIGDLCTIVMPDVLVLIFVSNYQNINGIKDLVSHARRERGRLPVDREHLICVPVPARDELNSEYDDGWRWRQIYDKELGSLFDDWLPREVDHLEALSQLYIPYVTKWSFGERLPVLEKPRERDDPRTIGAAYFRLARLLHSELNWNAVRGDSTEVVKAQLALREERDARSQQERELSALRRIVTRRRFVVGGSLVVAGLGAGLGVYAATRAPPARPPRTTYIASGPGITVARFSPDGSVVAAGLETGVVRVWTVGSSMTSYDIVLPAPISSIDFAPDGTTFVVTATDGTLNTYDAFNGAPVATRRLAGRPSKVRLSSDGEQFMAILGQERIVVGSAIDDGRSAIVYDLGFLRGQLAFPAQIIFLDAQFIDNSSDYALRAVERSGLLFDLSGAFVHLSTFARADDVRGFDFESPLIDCLISGDASKALVVLRSDFESMQTAIWDLRNPDLGFVLDPPASSFAFCFSDGATRVATTSVDEVRIWNAANGAKAAEFHTNLFPESIAFSPTGEELLTVAGRNVAIWGLGGDSLVSFDATGLVSTVDFASDGRRVLIGSLLGGLFAHDIPFFGAELPTG